jgi:putative ABC transport system permease protein
VTERLREIGVRAALGASRGDLVRMILRQGMSLTVAGVVAGIALTLAFVRVISGMLFGISQSDPGTYVAVTIVLGGVAVLACLIPAWRAARVDPAMTLRSE